jgi:flagellar hook protein FlgE
MNQGFYSGLSGLQSHQVGIDVTADNLASINTVGFRGYTAEFSSFYNDAVAASSSNNLTETMGEGSYVHAVSMNESQGTLLLTDSSTDLAIDGDGWFGVVNQLGETLYTRSGSFGVDAEYNLVARNDGMFVLGTVGNNIQNGALTQELSSIPLSDVNAQTPLSFPKDLYYPPKPSTEVSFYGNLGIENEVQSMGATLISTDGAKNELSLLFTQSENQPSEGVLWNVKATVYSPGGDTVISEKEGFVQFGANGGLIESTITSVDNDGTEVLIDLGNDHSGVISQSGKQVSAYSVQNGVERGDLVGYDIGLNGRVEATFTNGRSSAIANIALYHFMNDQGLERLSGTHFMEGANSGSPVFFQDENGNNILGANLLNHKLENSNVKMEVGMTELIILQRAYSANAKSVTTSDELIQKALNMDA